MTGVRFCVVLSCVALAGAACGDKGENGKNSDPRGTSIKGGSSGGGFTKPTGKGGVRKAPSRGPEYSVYSLLDNRLSAHRHVGGGLVVEAGSPGFVRYLRFRKQSIKWKLRQKRDEISIATMPGKVSGVTIPLTAEQAKGPIRVRLYSDKAQRLGLRINGKRGDKEVTTQVEAGWFTAELTPKPDTLRRGENDLLFFKSAARTDIAWIQVGGASPGDDIGPLYDASKSALVLPRTGGVAYYITVPDKGIVTGNLDDPKCEVAVRAEPESGNAIEGALVGEGSGVRLEELSGQVVRLELTASGCDSASLTGAAIVVPGKKPVVKRDKKPKHIVMWVMDSLRADKIGLFVKGARAETPVLDELAKTSAVFVHAYVQGNETKASHASIWTSLYPVVHRMIPPNSKLDKKWVTIDEVADSADMFTSGVSGNGYITPKRGFGTKWKKYRNHIHEGGGLKAENILGKGIESLAGKEKDPWFLYLGTIDTHVSWRAKEPWFSKYDPNPYKGRFKRQASGKDVGAIAGGKLKASKRDMVRIVALYDSNVSYQDQQVGELLKWLDEQGIRDDTMIIISADHGDELMEVGRIGHGSSIRDSLVHVPLIVHYPPLFPAGAISQGADLVDIVPTVADALGIEADERWQGESLVPLAQGVGRSYPKMSIATLYENAHVGRMGPWKLRAARGNAKFYNMHEEPTELTEVSAKHPYAMRMVADALWLFRAYSPDWNKAAWGNPANVTAKFAADQEK